MSQDKPKTSDRTAPAAPSPQAAPVGSGDDLFDFGEVPAASAAVAAEMRKELDDAVAQVAGAAQDLAVEIAPTSAPSAAANLALPSPEAQVESALATYVQHRLSTTPLLAALIGAVIVVNLALIAVALHSIGYVQDVFVGLSHEVADSTNSLRTAVQSEVAASSGAPTALFGPMPEGYQTLTLVQERIDQGEFARARRTLYGLLAIADRIEEPARRDIEARAEFLLAETYRGEALAVVAPAAPAAHEEHR